jgi:pimeloyl-ACP methyl ester carboxylesterase
MYAAIRWLSLARTDLTSTLDRVNTPTLLTTGTSDPMSTTTNANAAAAHLTHGALVILPGAGHIGPLLQAAPTVVELVNAFWRDPATMVAQYQGITAPPA